MRDTVRVSLSTKQSWKSPNQNFKSARASQPKTVTVTFENRFKFQRRETFLKTPGVNLDVTRTGKKHVNNKE